MKRVMLSPEEAANLIRSGHFLGLAADEAVLRQLPRGNWIGGTIPYFVGEAGGLQSRALVHVTDLAGPECAARIMDYTTATVPGIVGDAPDSGYTLLIIPALSALHLEYAANASDYDGMFMKPIIGWISGVHLDDLGKVSPKVVNGRTGQVSDSQAVAMHVPLPASRMAIIKILNLFRQGNGDVLTFPKDGFTVTDCLVNGRQANFAQYVQSHGLDLTRPLVADYSGAQINVSFQSVDGETGQVHFYAPVFAGVEYQHAAPVGDYVQDFNALVASSQGHAQFACNCILNYLYGKLEGQKTGGFTGPITFGEIGYQLLNQTLVYLEVADN
jgi:hypothetical protein